MFVSDIFQSSWQASVAALEGTRAGYEAEVGTELLATLDAAEHAELQRLQLAKTRLQVPLLDFSDSVSFQKCIKPAARQDAPPCPSTHFMSIECPLIINQAIIAPGVS